MTGLPFAAEVAAYLDDCAGCGAVLDPRFHPTEGGALKMIPHRRADRDAHQEAEDQIRAAYRAATGDPAGDDDGPAEDQRQEDTLMTAPSAAYEAGCGYIARGWPVFVLGRTKRPVANCPACKTGDDGHDPAACGCLTCHGFYAATLDPDRLAAMLRAVPRGLLAVRTGTASGLLVVDIDPRNGGRLDKDLMTPTAAVATGGGGWHLYYAHPGVPTRAALDGRQGVDLKGDGGYVTAPPSVHPGTGRPYRWAAGRAVSEMPPALRAAVVVPPSAAAPSRPGPPKTRAAGGISNPAALLAANLRRVAEAPEGHRRHTLYGAARGVARMVNAGALDPADAVAALTSAGESAGQTPREIRAAIDGAFTAEGAEGASAA